MKKWINCRIYFHYLITFIVFNSNVSYKQQKDFIYLLLFKKR
jgi:hypothetical protein